MAKYNIGGYIYDDEIKARKAAKELKAVEYILGQIKDADENGVLAVYKKLLNQRMFSTEIGLSFLGQLRKNLVASKAFDEADIPEVYKVEQLGEIDALGDTEARTESPKPEPKAKAKKQKADKVDAAETKVDTAELSRLRLINKVLLILCITLGLCVIGMFYVNSTINSPTILNYEEKLLDKYSAWEQELTEREAAVKERELNQQ